MRLVLIVLGLLSALLAIVLSILPFGSIAIIPIVLAFVFGFIAFKASKKEGQNTRIIKFIFLVTIIALCITIYRSIFDENIVEDDIETIQNEEESLEDAKKELEDLDID